MKNPFKLLSLPSYEFTSVEIEEGVILTICDIARSSHPLEFTALLEGKIRKNVLSISGMVYQQYEASENATAMHMDLPLLHGTLGSVHSHPGGSNLPSRTDLRFFNKHGIIHLIISEPFGEGNIACYDKNGRSVQFLVKRNK